MKKISAFFSFIILAAGLFAPNIALAKSNALRGPAETNGYKITNIDTSTGIITATKTNKSNTTVTYTVDTNSSTRIIRRYGAKSSLSEMEVNDLINIKGTWNDSSKTTITATLIRDGSIQARNDKFNGTVMSVDTGSNTLVIQTNHARNMGRGQTTTTQNVSVDSSTQITAQSRRGKKAGATTITLGDIKVGDKVVVSGLWDRTNSQIGPAKRIIDLSNSSVSPTGQ